MPISTTMMRMDCRRCGGILIYDLPHDEAECDRRALRGIVNNMRARIRGYTPVPVDAQLRYIVTTDGVHGGVPVARSGRGGR